MNGIDIILDMVVGSAKDESSPHQQASSPSTPSGKLDILDIFKMHYSQLEALRASLSHFSFKKMFHGKFLSFKKRRNRKNKNTDLEVAAAISRLENVFNFCTNPIKNSSTEYPSYFSSECDVSDKQLIGFDKNSSEEFNNNKETDNKKILNEIKNNNSNKKHDGLEIFLTSVLKTTTEFNDEEILELEIQILKIIKNIKGKRELKQHLRRYCTASLNFKDPTLFCNDLKNTMNII